MNSVFNVYGPVNGLKLRNKFRGPIRRVTCLANELDSLKVCLTKAQKGHAFLLHIADSGGAKVDEMDDLLNILAWQVDSALGMPTVEIVKRRPHETDNEWKELAELKKRRDISPEEGILSRSILLRAGIPLKRYTEDSKMLFTSKDYSAGQFEIGQSEYTNYDANSHVLCISEDNLEQKDIDYLAKMDNVKALQVTGETRLRSFAPLCKALNPSNKMGNLVLELNTYPEINWNLQNLFKKQRAENIAATWIVNPIVNEDQFLKKPTPWTLKRSLEYIGKWINAFENEEEAIGGLSFYARDPLSPITTKETYMVLEEFFHARLKV